MSNVILRAENLEKNFRDLRAVNNINFSLEKGDVFGFIGPNGSGKTTTIRMILGLLKADKGNVYINGHSIKDEYYEAVSSVGALVEGPAFYEYMTAEENLECFGSYSKGVTKERINYLLKLVGLSQRGKDKVKEFSLGMKQRLGIAQALLNEPELLILDEPTNGLDPEGIKDIRKLIKDLSNDGVTVFVSSHMLSEIENVCNKILIIKDGNKVVFGNTEELIRESGLYEIEAVDNKYLIKVLNTVHNVSIEDCEGKVKVKFKGELFPEDLLEVLVKKGVKIRSYSPTNLSLEEYFFNATGGQK